MGKSKDKSNIKVEVDESFKNEEDAVKTRSRSSAGSTSWEEKIKYLSPIARPLATEKLTKRLYKTIRKANRSNLLSKGLKEVQKSLRKGETGIVVLAGDVTPYDVISHIPVMLEEQGFQYCYVPSKRELGECFGPKGQACMVLIKDHESLTSDISTCKMKISELPREY